MLKNKLIDWPKRSLIGLLVLGGVLSLGLMMYVKPNTSQQNTTQAIKVEDTTANTANEKRFQAFNTKILKAWQEQAVIKGVAYAIPTSLQGQLINDAKLTHGKKVVALTFDDGPWAKSTPEILDILKKNNIKATFFVVGEMLKEHPELGQRIVTDGHIIANHTWHHWYRKLSQQEAAFEIDGTSNLIYKTTGIKNTIFRPPGGVLNNGVVDYAKSKNYPIIMWSADTEDYARPAPSTIVSRAERQTKPGGILLMHDGGGDRSNTVAALPEIISYFKKQGYSFATIPELLQMQEKDQAESLTAKK